MATKLVVAREFSTNGTQFHVGMEVTEAQVADMPPGALETRIENKFLVVERTLVDTSELETLKADHEAATLAATDAILALEELREAVKVLSEGAGAATKASLVSELESLVAGFPVDEPTEAE